MAVRSCGYNRAADLFGACNLHRQPRRRGAGAGGMGSAERERQETGAQQHKAGCGQREEPFGYKIMISHRTPVISSGCSSEFIKSFRIRPLKCFGLDQALERKPSNAWARKMPALTRPKIAVTVSTIANIHLARFRQNDCRAAQSKEFQAQIDNRS